MTDQIDQDVELDEDIEEAHDPKNAEAQSIASVDAAEKKGPVAKKRKGDKSNSQAMEKEPAAPAAMKAEDVQFDGDFSEDLNALVESEATLSDEFKAKTAVIFEAAIKSKLSEEINRLETEYAEQLAEEVTTTKADLVEKVDSYLNYVVENWMEENKMAIQSGLRAEIAEGFMEKLKDVFTESYIAVPDEKVDLVDDLSEQVKELETAINERTEEAMSLSVELDTFRREAVIAEASKGLADTQVEKLTKLVEGFEFHDAESFAEKVAIVKEANFKPEAIESTIAEETVDDASDAISEATSDVMQTYLSAIRKSTK